MVEQNTGADDEAASETADDAEPTPAGDAAETTDSGSDDLAEPTTPESTEG